MPSRYDPRYDYNKYYGAGNVALGLADLLGQGFDRYHKIGQDELAQQNNQRDYLTKLQQMLTQNAKTQRETDLADRERQAGADFLGALSKPQTTKEPAPMPAQQGLAVSPQAEDRTLANFIYGSRPTTAPEAAAAIGPTATANLPKNMMDELLKFYAPPPAPPATIAPGHGVRNAGGGYDVPLQAEEKPTPITSERTAALAASGTKKIQRGEAPTPEEQSAIDTYNLKADTATTISAAQGENAARAPLQPADAPRPQLPVLPSSPPRQGVLDRNPDFREAGVLPVPKGGSVDIAATRDLFGGQPTPTGPAGETVTERKTRLADEAALGVKQRAPIGEGAAHYVLKTTGLPPPPDMPVEQVQKNAVAVTQQQMQSLGAARRGLSIIRQFEDPKILALFPENPTSGKGLLGTLVNAARAQSFGVEAKVRGMSDPEYAKLVTSFATAIPALAKATGEVGNLSELEQSVVKQAIGITRTRAAFAAGINTYREILERGFKANGIPVPQELRGQTVEPQGSGTDTVDQEIADFLKKKRGQ